MTALASANCSPVLPDPVLYRRRQSLDALPYPPSPLSRILCPLPLFLLPWHHIPHTYISRCGWLCRPDVYIPTKKYAQVVTNMNEAKRRADSKLLKAQQEEIVLSKAERARYLADRKT